MLWSAFAANHELATREMMSKLKWGLGISILAHALLFALPLSGVGRWSPRPALEVTLAKISAKPIEAPSPLQLKESPTAAATPTPTPAAGPINPDQDWGLVNVQKDLELLPYPEQAYVMGISGEVEFTVRLNGKGQVEDIRVVGGSNSEYFTPVVMEALSNHQYSKQFAGQTLRGSIEFTHPAANNSRGQALNSLN